MERTVIKSDRIILPDREIAGYVIIEDSKIAGIVHHIPADYSRLVDVSNKVLMPGVIDPHVHINDPGRTHWEGFDTATRAAITGGITMLVDMPLNSSPVTTSVVAFEEKLRATQDCLHTNCGFWGGIVPGNHSEIDGLIKRGVLGFKAFLTHSGIDEFPNVSQADLEKAMPRIARHNLPLLVHCELSNDNAALTSDPRSYQQYLASRPKKWEDDAISLMIHLCEKNQVQGTYCSSFVGRFNRTDQACKRKKFTVNRGNRTALFVFPGRAGTRWPDFAKMCTSHSGQQ